MKLPRRTYWFSNAALAGAGVIFIGSFLSLVQVKSLLPNWALWLLVIASGVLLFVVWHAGAEQAQDAAIAQENSTHILENLSTLVTSRQTRDEPVDWGQLSTLSNPQLRDAALSLASQMRVFDANHREREDIRRSAEFDRQVQEGGFSQERFRADRVRDDVDRAAYAKAFNTLYLPKAIATRDELFARHAITPTRDSSSPYFSHTLDLGLLAGPSPVRDAATVLERLARSLP